MNSNAVLKRNVESNVFLHKFKNDFNRASNQTNKLKIIRAYKNKFIRYTKLDKNNKKINILKKMITVILGALK